MNTNRSEPAARAPFISSALDALERTIAFVAGSAFLTVFLLTLLNITSRNIGGIALLWIPGLTRLLFVWTVLLGTTVLYRRGDHLVMDYFVSMTGARTRARLTLMVDAIMIPFLALIIYHSERVVRVRMRIPYETWRFPTGYAYLALPVCGALMILFAFERIHKQRKELHR